MYIIQLRKGSSIRYWDAPVGNGTCGWPTNFKMATAYRTIEQAKKARNEIGVDTMPSGSINIVIHPVSRMIQEMKAL